VLSNRNIKRVIGLINKFENGLVIFFLFSILILAIFQIVLRNLFDSGLIWGDTLLSILVLWLGLTGSIVACREQKQINIDVFSQYIPEKYKIYVKNAGLIFAAFICIVISYYSFIFIKGEFLSGEYAFANIPVWLTESIIPFAFFVMGIRYFLQSVVFESGNRNK